MGVKDYLPHREEGEDDSTQEVFVNRMKTQEALPKHRRTIEIINLAMDKTFPDRRKMIVTEMALVTTVLDMYPLLKNDEEVCDVV